MSAQFTAADASEDVCFKTGLPKRHVAYHEAGHALVAELLPHHASVLKVTVASGELPGGPPPL